MKKRNLLYHCDNPSNPEEYKLLGFFNSALIATLLLCDVFIFKTIQIFHYQFALSGCIFPLTSLIMICINELYGHRETAKSLLNLIFGQIIFLIGLTFFPKIPSPIGFTPNIIEAYNIVFHNIWRVFLSSPIGIGITLYLSSMLNSCLKNFWMGKYLIPRMLLNSVITTFILVSIIYPINFYNLLSWNNIIKICFYTYVYKIVMSFVIVIISPAIVHFSKKVEKKYIFDINISFNPFLIYSMKSKGVNLYDKFNQ